MDKKHVFAADEPILNDVTVAYFYSFSFDFKRQMDAQNIKDFIRLRNHMKGYVWGKEKALNGHEHSSMVLRSMVRFENSYYFPEYLSMRKHGYIELESIKLDFQEQSIEARIFVALHEYGVGTVIFILEDINGITFDALQNLIFLDRIRSKYSVSYISIESISRDDSTDNAYNLTQVFRGLLSWLEEATKVEVRRRCKSRLEKTLTVQKEDPNLYVAVFVSDPGEVFETPEGFVKVNEKQVFELVEGRYHYKNRDFYSSRSDACIKSALKKCLGNRRHIAYYLTEERMTAISLAKYHQELYPYDFSWYLAYISMLTVVRLQFQLLSKLYKLLYVHGIKGDPLRLVKLRTVITHGLEEYENLRFPINERTREFIEECKRVMNLRRFVVVIENKIDMLTKSTTEYYNRVSQAKNDAITRAVNLLTVILSIPVAIQVVDKLFDSPPAHYYFLTWASIATFFYGLQRILMWATTRTLRRTRL